MVSYTSGEISIFMWSILCGAIIMTAYDVFCIFTNQDTYSVLVCNIFDALFITCASSIMIFIMLSVSNGYIRFYEFLGAFIGAFFYKCTLSRLFKPLFYRIIYGFFAIFQLFFKILLTPIRFMYKIMYNSISVLCRVANNCVTPFFKKCVRGLSLIKISLKKT